MKTFLIIGALLWFCSYANAETWSTTFSGSLSQNATRYHYWVFPAAGTASVSCSGNGSSTFQLVGVLFRSGSSIAGSSAGSASTASFLISNQQVWPVDTYSMYMMCPYGSCSYYGSVNLTYSLNTPPVISSLTVTPSSPVYGAPVTVVANVADAEENISYVRFVNETVSADVSIPPYKFTYSNLSVGAKAITVYVIDSQGESDEMTLQFVVAPAPLSSDLTQMSGSCPSYSPMSSIQSQESTMLQLIVGEWNKTWFGNIYVCADYDVNTHTGWVYHPSFGWVCLIGASDGNLWYYHPKDGWIWTSQDRFEFAYSDALSSWITAPLTGRPWLYDVSMSSWVLLERYEYDDVGKLMLYDGPQSFKYMYDYDGSIMSIGLK